MKPLRNRIIDFWNHSEGLRPRFDYDGFVREFAWEAWLKLAGHGQLTFADYLRFLKDRCGYDLASLERYTYSSEHTGYVATEADIAEAIFYPRYLHFHDRYINDPGYVQLRILWKKLKQAPYMDRQGKHLLVDECLHAMHSSGFIIENIEEVRANYEAGRHRLLHSD